MTSETGGDGKRATEDLNHLRNYLEKVRVADVSRLPPERELAATLGLSRSRLRVALKQLADEGMIWRGVGNGTYLGPRPLVFGQNARAAALAEMTNPREVMEARLAIEPEIARMAAYRAKKPNVDEMVLCLDKMRVSADISEWMFWDKRLHRALCRAADNTLMMVMLEAVQQNMGRESLGGLVDNLHTGGAIKASEADHEAIVAAVQARNPDGAAQAMRAHLERIRRAMFGEDSSR